MEKQYIFEFAGLLSGYLTIPLLYTIEYYFLKRFLGFKSKPWKFILFALLITIIDFYTMKITSEPIRIIIYNLIWLIVVCILCKGNFLIKFYAVILQETVLLLISLAFLVFDFGIIPITYKINMLSNENVFIYFIKNIINDISRFTILFIFLKNICDFLNLKEKSLNPYQSLYLLIPCLSSYSLAGIFFLIQRIKIEDKKYYLPYIFPKVYYILPFVSFALLISIMITAYTFKKMLEGEEEKQKNMLMEQQFKLQLTHSKNIEGFYSGVRGVMHDMNNHLLCLRSLADSNNTQEIKKYLCNIGETIEKLDFKIKTGNSISDAIINEKYNIAKEEEIEFICDFMIPKEISLEPVDLCVILSNTLDNAIEACIRIGDNDIPKTIWIKSYIRDIYLIIEVSNTTVDKIQYAEGKIVSRKLDKYNHGMGISNIKSVSRKYDGIVDIVEEKNKFIINVMMKIK